LKKAFFFIFVFAAICCCDQALKYCAYFHIQAPVLIAALPFNVDLSLHLATNTGGPWGVFSSWQMSLLALRILLCGAIIIYLIKARITGLRQFCLTLVLAGALSNVFDTFYYGFVIDMIHFTFSGRSFGIFNIADASIFTGVILSLFEKKGGARAASN
jgi:lipoprotein signal peptidase